jgi:hypothetical protein
LENRSKKGQEEGEEATSNLQNKANNDSEQTRDLSNEGEESSDIDGSEELHNETE